MREIIGGLPEYYNGLGFMDILANLAGVRLTDRSIVYRIEDEERERAARSLASRPNARLIVGLQLTTKKDAKRSYPHGPALIAEGVRLLRSGMAPRLHEMVAGDAGAVTPKEIAAAAEAGDEALRAAIGRMAGYLGIGVANVITALHPEMVVLGGGVAAIEALLDGVRAAVRQRVRMFPVEGVRIERSVLGDQAGIYGGIALARDPGALPPRLEGIS